MPRLLANRGLQTQQSELTRPEGSLSIADNVVIDFDNTIQPRRGFLEYSQALATSPKQLLTYKNKILVHYGSTLAYDSNDAGTFVNFAGTYSELISGLRIKYLETSGNCYFTTNEGIKKISSATASDIATTTIINAGAAKAIDLTGKLIPDSAGFLPKQSKVAYRIVFGYKDASSNLLLGTPSARLVLTNQSQDVEQSEIFTINVANYAAIVDGDYFLFSTNDTNYFVWFKKTSGGTAPVNADTLDREGIEVDIQTATSNNETAAYIANSLSSTITGISVELTGPEVEVTINSPGDASDASQGSLLTTEVLITKVFDGSISEGTNTKSELTFTVPPDVTTDYFYQIYRTAYVSVTPGVTLSDIDPGDEQYYVYESPVTSGDISAGTITVEENTPDSFRAVGAPLYTNAITGSGITQANERPPIAHDIALFRNSVFYANTKEVHRTNFTMLSVDDFVSNSTKFYTKLGSTVSEYTFVGVTQVTDITPIQRSLTVGNSYITINAANDEREYYIWMDKGVISHTFDSTANVDDGVLNFIQVTDHGFQTGDKVTFTGITPGGISTGTTYYIVRKAASEFAVSLTPGGPEVDITSQSVGNATVTHLPEDPALTGKTGIRIPLEVYADTDQGSKDALLDSLLGFPDFSAVDFSSSDVRITNADNGASTTPTDSSPASGWTFSVVTAGEGEDAANNEVLLSQNSSVGLAIDLTARSLVRVINQDSLSPLIATYLSGSDDLPGQILLEAKTLVDTPFYIAISDPALTSEFSPEIPSWDEIASFPTSVVSDNNVAPNRLYFSKTSQPEAVPLTNYVDVGSKDKPILRILSLRDNLFVLKTDGIYLVSGTVAPQFSVRLLDNSAILTAPDTAVVLNNLIYCLSTQGIISISDSGVSIVSRQIEDQIKKVTTFAYNFKYTSFGITYESDRSYIVWLPTLKSDTKATQAFRYNTITNTWTRWVLTNTCGLVNVGGDDRMYIGKGDRDFIAQERKNGERQDYSDRDFDRSIGELGVDDTTITLSSVADIETGDTFVQEQYVTIIKFNRLLKKLDSDNGPADNDYYESLMVVPGQNMGNTLQQLVVKLNADPNLAGTFTTPSGSNVLDTLKTDYNTMVAELNAPGSGTAFKDYNQATDLLYYEVNITDTVTGTNDVVIDRPVNLIVGDITVYKAIKTKVQWATQHFGTPEKLKQINEGTLIFDQGTIRNGIISYSTDRSANFEEIPFTMDGPGFWSGFTFGETVYGGNSNDIDVRTLIPQDKSYCRYINVMFQHFNAREQYKLIGISFEPREVSTRAYR